MMKVAIYSIHKFEKEYLLSANSNKHDLVLIESRLSKSILTCAAWATPNELRSHIKKYLRIHFPTKVTTP